MPAARRLSTEKFWSDLAHEYLCARHYARSEDNPRLSGCPGRTRIPIESAFFAQAVE